MDRVDGQIRVVDFKTGIDQGAPTQQQVQQLSFYCALVESILGELPGRAEVQDAEGALHSVAIDPAEVASVVRRAEAALVALQEASDGKGELQARPSEENCSGCPFRVVCGPFLAAYQPDWRCSLVRVGTVVATRVLGAHTAIDVDIALPTWGPRQMTLVAFPFKELPTLGEVLGFSDFEGPSATGLARWNTLVTSWSSLVSSEGAEDGASAPPAGAGRAQRGS